MKTPYFLINEAEINKNVNEFKAALKKYWSNSVLAYSVKTNSLPWILEYMNKSAVLAEVVSDEEYQLAIKCGFSDDRIVFNGPIKGEEYFLRAIEKRAVVNIDSENELELLSKNEKVKLSEIGIRLNVDIGVFPEGDVDYREDGFRFGFSHEACGLKRALDRIRQINENCRIGLHLHCNSITRSLDVYRSISKYTAMIVETYGLTPSYIDVGGGFFGGVAGKPTAEEYISVIAQELSRVVDPKETRLIIEPGSAIIGSAVDLHSSVLDVKSNNRSRIITTDASRILIDPLWKKSRYFYSVDGDSDGAVEEKQIVCGYTCMDFDRIMVLKDQRALSIGDKIVYHKVGAYTMTFGGPFIRYYPAVYVKSGTEIKKVRQRMSVDSYYSIHKTEEEHEH